MALTLDSVTLTSLILASAALVIAILSFMVFRSRLQNLKSLDKGLDAYAIVQEFSQRSKKLEERLIDQKVRLEILELRQQRQTEGPRRESRIETIESRSQTIQEKHPPGMVQKPQKTVGSEAEALHAVIESGTKGATAKEIQSRIGRSREHTARMMNSLFKQGLVQRSVQRPFTYTITKSGENSIRE